MPLHWAPRLEDLWRREEFKCVIRVQWKCFCPMTGRSKDCQSPGTGVNLQLGLVGLAYEIWCPVNTAVVCSLLLWCSPQLTEHPWRCLMVCFPMCVVCRLPEALWGPSETYHWSHSPPSLCVWWSTQYVCITDKLPQPRLGEVKMVWTNQFLCNWELFTVKWNTLSFGVNKMCTYKIWKCMVAVPVCCQECWMFIF